MTGDDGQEFVRVVEEGLLGLADESMAPPSDLHARIRDHVTRRRRRGVLGLSAAALACAAAVTLGWPAADESSKAAASGSSKAAADPVARASPRQVSTSETGAQPWWPLTDDRFTQIHPSAALTDFWDARTGGHHTDVHALKTMPFGNKSLILLVGHSSDGTPRIGLMAGLVLPDGSISGKGTEFFSEQRVTSPSAPIAIAAYPLSDGRSMSTVAIVAPSCPGHWRITTRQAGGDETAVAAKDDPQGDLILTKMAPPQSTVTTRCGTETFQFGAERIPVATSQTIRFELLTQR